MSSIRTYFRVKPALPNPPVKFEMKNTYCVPNEERPSIKKKRPLRQSQKQMGELEASDLE